MDIEIQPGPYSLILNSTGSRSLQYSQLIHTTFDGSTVNFNFPARNAVYHYSRQQLLNLRSRPPVSTNLFLSLKGLGILKTRRVRAGKTAKQRTSTIPVIIGRRNEKTTQVSFPDQKSPNYHDVNKPSKRGSTAIDLNIASAHVHAQNHNNLIVATSREQNNSKDFNALQNQQSKSQCLSFNAATINCESAKNKTLDLTDYISELGIDVCCLTETWMTENDPVTAGEICPPGYELQSIPRKDCRGGGVAVILKQPLSFKSSQYCPPNSFQSFEHLNTVILHPHHSKSINLTVVYRPPRSDKYKVPTSVFLDEISELFAALSMTPDCLLITGDFNAHVDTPNDPTAAKFLSILESFGLVQHVAVPTHVAGHTLDLVITREDCDLLTCSPVAHYMISSHSTVLFPLSMAKPNRPTIVRTCRKIKSIDMDRFRSDIESSLLLSSPAENMDNLAEQYQETLSRILENHTPKVSIRVRDPWYSSDTAEAKLDRRRLECRWRRSKLEFDRQLFVEAQNNVSRLLMDAKTSFYSARIHELSGNQKALFSEMNHLLHKPTETPLPPHDSLKYSRINLPSIFRRRLRKLDMSCSVVSDRPLQHLQHNRALSEVYVNSRRSTMFQLRLFLS